MQEEVTNKSVTLVIRTFKLTADVLRSAMSMYLRAHNQKKNSQKALKQQEKLAKKREPPVGKIKIKELAKQNAGMTSIEITNKNIKSFERYARKYGINFALKKDKTKDPPVYLVFFKGRDQDAIHAAFREFSQAQIRKSNKVGIRKRLALHKAATKQQNKNKVRNKHQVQTR